MGHARIVIVLKQVYHREQPCIAIPFPKDPDLIRIVKAIPGSKFSFTMSCWYVPNRNGLVNEIIAAFSDTAIIDRSHFIRKKEQSEERRTAPLNENTQAMYRPMANSSSRDLLEEQRKFLRMMEQRLRLKGYSANTLKTYLQQFKEFLFFYHDSSPVDLTESEIRNYLIYLVERKKVSKSFQNQAINAIKFFYEKIMMQERKVYYLERPMREKRLPKVLSQESLIRIFEALENIKHKVMLMLTYAAGLRRSELLALNVGDIDLDRHVVFIRGGKGKKDRQSIMAKSLAPLLKQYIEEYAPSYWLFEGRAGDRYTESSLRQVLKQAVAKAGIKKNITLHMLRHSFATHLLEAGTSTRYIQELLGHESPVTTEIYAQVTRFGLDKIQSPLDQIAETKQLRGDEE